MIIGLIVDHLREKAKRKKKEQREKRLLRKIHKTEDRDELFQYYRETEKDDSKYEVYEKLTQSEPTMMFGGREWFVLRKEEDRCLLLSRFLLKEFKSFAEKLEITTHYLEDSCYYTSTMPHWQDSIIRQYLNGEFLNSFTSEERDRILPVHIPCNSEKSECLKTRSEAQQFSPSEIDDVFLLSITEIREFAQNSIAVRNGFSQSHSAYHWWTRTTSSKTNIMDHGYRYTSVVVCLPADDLKIIPPDHDEWIHSFADTAGSVYKTYPNISGIRPALWISCSEKPETV